MRIQSSACHDLLAAARLEVVYALQTCANARQRGPLRDSRDTYSLLALEL